MYFSWLVELINSRSALPYRQKIKIVGLVNPTYKTKSADLCFDYWGLPVCFNYWTSCPMQTDKVWKVFSLPFSQKRKNHSHILTNSFIFLFFLRQTVNSAVACEIALCRHKIYIINSGFFIILRYYIIKFIIRLVQDNVLPSVFWSTANSIVIIDSWFFI